MIRDRPALSGTDITDPKANFDQFNQPDVTFSFTDTGRQEFSDVTKAIAQRGLQSAPPGSRGQLAARRRSTRATSRSSSTRQIKSRPIVNFVDNPDGIDGRTGAEINGLTQQESQDLAQILQIGALPVDLVQISSSTVSATLGQQALDQGLKAGIVGLILVCLFLLAYYRFLGFVAVVGLAIYGVLFFALIKLIPITLTLPGIAGLILTIGVAADANIVIFERIKEEARGGKSMLSAISAGYRARYRDDHRRERDHADHGVHPLRARDFEREGVRVHPGRRHDRLAVHGGRLHAGLPRAFSAGPASCARRPLLGAPRAALPLALRLQPGEQVLLHALRRASC